MNVNWSHLFLPRLLLAWAEALFSREPTLQGLGSKDALHKTRQRHCCVRESECAFMFHSWAVESYIWRVSDQGSLKAVWRSLFSNIIEMRESLLAESEKGPARGRVQWKSMRWNVFKLLASSLSLVGSMPSNTITFDPRSSLSVKTDPQIRQAHSQTLSKVCTRGRHTTSSVASPTWGATHYSFPLQPCTNPTIFSSKPLK